MSSSRDFFSINLHLTSRCNMSCRMCFAKYESGKALDEHEWAACIDKIHNETGGFGKRKINFVGGEPLLISYLPELISRAKRYGFTTGIVTNGRLLDLAFLDANLKALDWIGLSVDSLEIYTNELIGRQAGNVSWGYNEYISLVERVRTYCYKLKINTVISALNIEEDFNNFIAEAKPDRWKVFQCLVVLGQNDDASEFSISNDDYKRFLERHRHCEGMVPEDSEAMTASYIMVDPMGRPYGNAEGEITYGHSILEQGLLEQLPWLGYSLAKAKGRSADYF